MNRTRFVAGLLAILVIGATRLVHLEADTPRQITRFDPGIFVDEGYKTLDPRNLVQFGEKKWNPYDEYRGWIESSPVTQWPFYWAFRLWGVRVGSARIVTIGWFLVFLGLYWMAVRRDYASALAWSGLVLLGFQHVLFFFSRVALFEVPIIVFLYGSLFMVRARAGISRRSIVIGLVIAALLAAFFVKRSALLYFVALFAGLGLQGVIEQGRPFRVLRRIAVPTLLVLGGVLALTRDTWLARLQFDARDAFIANFFNPLMYSPVLVVLVGTFCLSHFALTRWRALFASTYRSGLVGLAVVGPVLLSVFPYNPLRYYIPLLPAYLLLALEWVNATPWRLPADRKMPRLVIAGTVFVGTIFVFAVLHAVNFQILFHIPVLLGEQPGLSERFLRRFFPALFACALLCAIGLWMLRIRWVRPRVAIGVFSVLVVLSVVRDGFFLGRFMANPSYASRDIAADLVEQIPADGALSGDWAPFLTLGTPVRALYMFRDINRPERLPLLRPSHFLYCDTPTSNEHMQLFAQETEVELGPVQQEYTYIELRVVLYPLLYPDEPG